MAAGGEDETVPEGGAPFGGDMEPDMDTDPVKVEVTDELDLHTFDPRDVPSLIPEYLEECARLGLRQVRIVHGKGRGVLRRMVQAALERSPRVEAHRLAGESAGGWGATLVTLRADPEGRDG